MRANRGMLWAFAMTLLSVGTTQAGTTWGEEYARRIRATELVAPLGDEMFGDSIKLFDGSLSFSAVDISLPGNSDLPVELRRTMDLQDRAYPKALYDWNLDIPYIGGVFGEDYEEQMACDKGTPPILIVQPNNVQFLAKDYWSGTQLHVPGGGEMLVDHSDPEVQKPSFAVSKWRTKDGWFFTCLSAPLASGEPSQGFYGYAPDGKRYTFNWQVVRTDVPIAKQNDPYHGTMLVRWDVRLYATRVEDRFGNVVNYVWAGNDLDKIQASDGREIDFTYGTPRAPSVACAPLRPGVSCQGDFGPLISATAHGRTWSYAVGTSPQGAVLGSVGNPDGSTWTFDSTQLNREIVYEEPHPGDTAAYHYVLEGRCQWMPQFNVGAGAFPAGGGDYTIMHPSGASAKFTLVPKRHGRTNLPISACKEEENSNATALHNEPAMYHDVLSVTAKQIAGPAIGTGTYGYAYADVSGDHAAFSGDANWGSYTPPPPPHTKTVTVTEPDGITTTVHSFGKDFQLNEGRLLQTQVKKSGQVYETRTHTYLPESEVAALPLPDRMGSVLAMGVDEYSAAALRPVIARTITRDATTYTWQVITGCHGSSLRCLDAFGRPIYVQRFSPTGNRTEYFEYQDSPSLWVIGQPKRQVNSDTGLEESKTDYTANAQPWKRYRFGQLQETLTYYAAGTLQTVADGAGNTITLSNWKRGVPQTITYPTQLRQAGVFDTDTALVNDRGEIDAVTDELGNTTCYGYDPMGRLASVTYPSETQTGVCDAAAWTPTTSSFVKVASVEYGLPAGHWRHTVSTGARKKETFYDALWRPVLTRESTTDGSAGVRAMRRTFDWDNRETFASYPVASFVSYTDAAFNLGTDTLYDPLGRVTGTAIDSELVPSVLTTSTSYANGQTVHTNARGYSTTTTYQAFDEPNLEAPLTITAPEGITTTYTRDLFGKPLTLSRSGTYTPPSGPVENLSATRRFVYDPQQRLCKTIEPDAGIAIMNYDAAGNLAWRASGQAAFTSTSDCQRTSVASADQSVHAYDARNRLLWINHPSGTSDVSYGYAADGAMLTASVSQTGNTAAPPFVSPLNTWTYSYKRRRLLEKESLAITGVAAPFELTWFYNARGDRSSLSYPSGHNVSFNPNAYGEPRQVGSYATNASYHASGSVAGFTYGNGTTRSTTPNTRQLPAQIVDVRSGTKWLDHTLTYDTNGNLKSLTDGVVDPEGQPAETRTLTYDGRDRLIGVTNAPSGSETYAYDPLDNVRRSVIGGIDRRFTVHPTTQRLTQITRVGSIETLDYQWNDRGEVTSRSKTIPSTPVIVPPTIQRNGFEDAVLTTTESFTFDRAGQLANFQNSATYHYDAHHRRVLSDILGWGKRYQVYSRAGDLMYIEDAGSNERTEFFQLDNTLVAERTRPLVSETATVNYLHSDHRGTPTVKTSSAGTRVYRSRLMPYGAPYDGIWREGPGFTKHAADEVAAMVYMQQRYFDPNLPIFISPDPNPANAENFNRYAYANNNPYTFVDPDGRESACFSNRAGCGLWPLTPAQETQNVVTMTTVGALALGGAIVGPLIAPIAADVPALGVAGAVMANPIEATVLAGVAAESAAAASGATIPSSALVVRGGNAANQTAAKIDGAIGPSRTPGITGFSAQCNGGTCLSTLSAPLRNNQVGVTTVGEIRAAGGGVVPTPGLGNHVTVTNLPGEKASPLFKVVPNPNTKQDRP
jgi:RHS repeat-associated protein